MSHTSKLILSAAILSLSTPARADWQVASSGGVTYLEAVATPDGDNIFVCGNQIDDTNIWSPNIPRVFASADAGSTFVEISGSLAINGTSKARAVFFFDAAIGWVAIGDRIHRTVNRGATWSSFTTGVVAHAIRFFTPLDGVLVGDGGAVRFTQDGGETWSSATLPVTTDIHGMFWLDRQRGWITAYNSVSNSFTRPEQDAAVFFTSDGGQTWQSGAAIGDRGLGPIFFLADGQNGWLAAWDRIEAAAPDADAALLRTSDGGLTFTDTGLPLVSGLLDGGIGDPGNINTSKILAMHWSSTNRGHLAAIAHIADVSSRSGSTAITGSVWRIVDYQTDNGGASWQQTDLGTLQIVLGMPPTLPDSDGELRAGMFLGHNTGWLVADANKVWRYEASCVTAATCGTGYDCVAGTCQLVTIPGGDGGGGGGDSMGGDYSGAGTRGGGERGDTAGGCACSANNGTLPSWLALQGIAALIWSQRRRRRHRG